MNDTIDQILKLRAEGMKAKEIAEALNKKGLKTPQGLHFTKAIIYSSITNYNHKLKNQGVLPMIRKKKTEMITLPVEEQTKQRGKVVAIIADFEDVERIVSGWLKHG